MKRGREVAIALLVAAAILSGLGGATGLRLLTALSFACFAAAAVVILRTRRSRRR